MQLQIEYVQFPWLHLSSQSSHWKCQTSNWAQIAAILPIWLNYQISEHKEKHCNPIQQIFVQKTIYCLKDDFYQ